MLFSIKLNPFTCQDLSPGLEINIINSYFTDTSITSFFFGAGWGFLLVKVEVRICLLSPLGVKSGIIRLDRQRLAS